MWPQSPESLKQEIRIVNSIILAILRLAGRCVSVTVHLQCNVLKCTLTYVDYIIITMGSYNANPRIIVWSTTWAIHAAKLIAYYMGVDYVVITLGRLQCKLKNKCVVNNIGYSCSQALSTYGCGLHHHHHHGQLRMQTQE